MHPYIKCLIQFCYMTQVKQKSEWRMDNQWCMNIYHVCIYAIVAQGIMNFLVLAAVMQQPFKKFQQLDGCKSNAV